MIMTVALVLTAIGTAIMLASLAWGVTRVFQGYPKVNEAPARAIAAIGGFLVGQILFDTGVMFYLTYLIGRIP